MLKYIVPLLLSVAAFPADLGMQAVGGNRELVINNRPLVKVQGQTISLMDVMKSMDVYIHEHYPELKDNAVARYQFYTHNWRRSLDEMILEKLVICDADGKDMKITDADVRQELDSRFGPDVILNLNKIGLTYEEGKELIHSDLIVQKLLWFRVYSRAQADVRPQDIKGAYTAYVDENPPREEWEYDVVTFRGKEAGKLAQQCAAKIGAELPFDRLLDFADQASSDADKLVAKTEAPLKEVAKIALDKVRAKSMKITAAKDYKVDTKTISQNHKQILESLSVGETSPAVAQVSRVAGEEVYRIFHLKDHKKVDPDTFDRIHNKLKDGLMGKKAAKYRAEYLAQLQEKFGLTDEEIEKSIPKDYVPFSLR